jgi:hypothetical protein
MSIAKEDPIRERLVHMGRVRLCLQELDASLRRVNVRACVRFLSDGRQREAEGYKTGDCRVTDLSVSFHGCPFTFMSSVQ